VQVRLGRSIRVVGLAGSLLVVLAAGAAADVTFNGDGSGFVGKGDAQAALGWSNAQFQANAALVDFRHENTTTRFHVIGCMDDATGQVVSSTEFTSTNGTITDYGTTPRSSKGKITGFGLQPGAVRTIGQFDLVANCSEGRTPFDNVTATTQTDALEVTGGAGWVVVVSYI
jgi:hypothetical protein